MKRHNVERDRDKGREKEREHNKVYYARDIGSSVRKTWKTRRRTETRADKEKADLFKISKILREGLNYLL